jgi:hypothetical protein
MRTTVDMPDDLMKRVKQETARRQITFRTLVIDAVEKALENEPEPFVLREAAAGYNPKKKSNKGAGLSSDQVNKAIDQLRDPAADA